MTNTSDDAPHTPAATSAWERLRADDRLRRLIEERSAEEDAEPEGASAA